ncbi:hypothetical protein U6A24_12625 [Aquimarina gracilis]|uniref:Annexin n=1 Tax=Aquimarina gracilis TaxID=874422 RepID=A0ABU5ZWQ6_9FLAO|nr:hypothetical protein [Aquimarina gracilis]MEB3346314.1 hypothetical protein [Aquimarina gracilis]
MGTTTLTKKETKQKAKELASKSASAAKKGINKTGDFVAKNPKTALYVVGGVVVGYLAYVLIKTLRTGADVAQNILNPDIDNSIDVGDLDTSGSRIGIQQAKIYAQQLLDAMNHGAPFWGTDEETILQVFKKITPEDFKIVYNAFGKKDYNGYNSPPTGILANLDSYQPRDLVYWLNAELSPSDGEVYRVVKQTLNDAGFAF